MAPSSLAFLYPAPLLSSTPVPLCSAPPPAPSSCTSSWHPLLLPSMPAPPSTCVLSPWLTCHGALPAPLSPCLRSALSSTMLDPLLFFLLRWMAAATVFLLFYTCSSRAARSWASPLRPTLHLPFFRLLSVLIAEGTLVIKRDAVQEDLEYIILKSWYSWRNN